MFNINETVRVIRGSSVHHNDWGTIREINAEKEEALVDFQDQKLWFSFDDLLHFDPKHLVALEIQKNGLKPGKPHLTDWENMDAMHDAVDRSLIKSKVCPMCNGQGCELCSGNGFIDPAGP